MRKVGLAIVGLFLVALIVEAGNSTLVYTAPQSQQIQNRLIPLYNRSRCRIRTLKPACTSADLVAAGCTTRIVRSLTVESCTIFPQNAAGEQAFLQERSNIGLATLFTDLAKAEPEDFCKTFKAMTQPQQDAICASLVPPLPPGCAPCP